MKRISTSILLILTIVSVTAQNYCVYNFVRAKYTGECIRDCKQYSTFDEAQIDCDKFEDCVGISYSLDKIDNNKSYHFLTGKGKYDFATHFSFIKNCEGNLWNVQLRGFTQKAGKYLSICYDGCRDYETLDEALKVCHESDGCAGVTLSRKEAGGYNTSCPIDGTWGFQLKISNVARPSTLGETSWISNKYNS